MPPPSPPNTHRFRTTTKLTGEDMAEVWFWLVIMVAAAVGIFALIVHVHSGGAREFVGEMRGPKAADPEGGEDAATEAAAA